MAMIVRGRAQPTARSGKPRRHRPRQTMSLPNVCLPAKAARDGDGDGSKIDRGGVRAHCELCRARPRTDETGCFRLPATSEPRRRARHTRALQRRCQAACRRPEPRPVAQRPPAGSRSTHRHQPRFRAQPRGLAARRRLAGWRAHPTSRARDVPDGRAACPGHFRRHGACRAPCHPQSRDHRRASRARGSGRRARAACVAVGRGDRDRKPTWFPCASCQGVPRRCAGHGAR